MSRTRPIDAYKRKKISMEEELNAMRQKINIDDYDYKPVPRPKQSQSDYKHFSASSLTKMSGVEAKWEHDIRKKVRKMGKYAFDAGFTPLWRKGGHLSRFSGRLVAEDWAVWRTNNANI